MGKTKIGYDEFLQSVEERDRESVARLQEDFLAAGCDMEIKEAKSGYVVSYRFDKKTIANYVFRKKGLMVRLYANHLPAYMEFLDTLPEGMKKSVRTAPDCKRLLNPESCNPKCAMGYDFLLDGERCQKCRNSAFFFLLCEETFPWIQAFLQHELSACR